MDHFLFDARRRQLLQAAAGSLTLGAAPLAALAQAMPDNLKIICGFAPGGTSDTISRRTGDKLAGAYAKNVVVDNRAGAGGRIAIDAVKASPPDGATLLLTPGSMLFIYPLIYKALSYNLANFCRTSRVAACACSRPRGRSARVSSPTSPPLPSRA